MKTAIFEDYLETHYEIVKAIVLREKFLDDNNLMDEDPVIGKILNEKGMGGLWELATELTDEFQSLNKDREWDGEFFDELENFLENKL
jgi:hypothetical protein